MLLPDNIHPELSIYYLGSIVLEEMKKSEKRQNLFDLYNKFKQIDSMSFGSFILCLDWLYMLDVVEMDEDGCICRCL